MRVEKTTFSTIFILAALTLMILPFLTSSTDLLTGLFIKFEFYRYLQETVVPYEMNLLKIYSPVNLQETCFGIVEIGR